MTKDRQKKSKAALEANIHNNLQCLRRKRRYQNVKLPYAYREGIRGNGGTALLFLNANVR